MIICSKGAPIGSSYSSLLRYQSEQHNACSTSLTKIIHFACQLFHAVVVDMLCSIATLGFWGCHIAANSQVWKARAHRFGKPLLAFELSKCIIQATNADQQMLTDERNAIETKLRRALTWFV